MTEEELREKIAELEHEQWAHWYKYMRDNTNIKNTARWNIQANTSYTNLSEKEKDSDRVWADKVITLTDQYYREAGWKSPEEIKHLVDEEFKNGMGVLPVVAG